MAASDLPEAGFGPGVAVPVQKAGEAVIDRAFAVLGAFDAEHRVLSLAGLVQRTGLPRSTALRLARKLTETGALERLDDGRYVIGLRLLEIASLAPRGHGLRAVAMPYLEDLFHVTRQHILLAVRDGDAATLVERLSAHDASPALYRVGGRMPLTGTGVGLVLLAHAPADVQEHFLERFEEGQSYDGVRTAESLRRVLAEVRRGGYAIGSKAGPEPHTTAAAPIRDADGVVAAVSVVAPSADFDAAIYVPAVRATARAVSRAMNDTRRIG
ncbi:IclR family transcriptional regulator [Nonomuraea fuscirosea]|uniref:IclR family transcriptional regulator n=1 Tax=Nonomuraea fuscirosea TaxID=1291556 RepID=UPI002DDBDC24|nr:IclR family transcriptional regulator [Nonomuraea fuscirosea]WSA55999.1 IclR family transcriptional regulator [Nonomuraea fuscirosea]